MQNVEMPKKVTVNGTVETVQMMTQTTAISRSSGGGGYLYGGTGHVAAPHVDITFSSRNMLRVFVRRDDNSKLLPFDVDATELGVAEGHRVKMNFFDGNLVAVLNDETDRWVALASALRPYAHKGSRSLVALGWALPVLSIVLPPLVFSRVGTTMIITMLVGVGAGAAILYANRRSRALNSDQNKPILKFATSFRSASS